MQNQSNIYSAGSRFRNIGIALLTILILSLVYLTLPFALNVYSEDDLKLITNVGIILSIISVLLSFFIIFNMIKAGIDLMNYSNNSVGIQSGDSVGKTSSEKTSITLTFHKNENVVNIAQLLLIFFIGFILNDVLHELSYTGEGYSFFIPILLYAIFITLLSYKDIKLYSINLTLSSIKKFALRYILSIVAYLVVYVGFSFLPIVSYPIVGVISEVEAMNYFVTLLLMVRIGVNVRGYLNKQ